MEALETADRGSIGGVIEQPTPSPGGFPHLGVFWILDESR
jgi:hypothetical protein